MHARLVAAVVTLALGSAGTVAHTASAGSDPEDVRLPCGDTECAAWLYLPAVPAPDALSEPAALPGASRGHAAVVMAHGLAGTRDLFLPAIGRSFAARGLAVLIFDYRSFGASGGTPRQVVDIAAQLDDWRAALTYMRSRPDIDAARIGVWGTSLSGGHVLVTAADDAGIRAVVARVPFVDGQVGARASWLATLRGGLALTWDLTKRTLGLGPHYVAVLKTSWRFALINTPSAREVAQTLIPPELRWRNEVAARVVLALPSYRPGLRAREIAAPLLLVPARQDELVPLEVVEAIAASAPHATVRALDGGHFSLYAGESADRITAVEGAFFAAHLLGQALGDAAHTDPAHTDPAHTDPAHTDGGPTPDVRADAVR